MTKEEIFDSLKDILSTVKPSVESSSIAQDSKLVEDLGIDSLSILLLSIAIETKFGFQFGNVPPFKTVGEVVDFIEKKIA